MVVRLPEPNIIAKRLFDLQLAAFGVIMLSPLLLHTAALVCLRFGRPVFFVKSVQDCMGVHSKFGSSERWWMPSIRTANSCQMRPGSQHSDDSSAASV